MVTSRYICYRKADGITHYEVVSTHFGALSWKRIATSFKANWKYKTRCGGVLRSMRVVVIQKGLELKKIYLNRLRYKCSLVGHGDLISILIRRASTAARLAAVLP